MRAVLTFHSVDDTGSVLSFPTRAFATLVDALARSGTPVVEFAELMSRDRGVTITFDDGMRTVHEHALPVLRDHHFPAHLFLATGFVGKDIGWPLRGGSAPRFDMLSWSDIEACAAGGIRFECHTQTHPDLRTLDVPAIAAECAAADDEIERRTGRRPRLFAYPFGFFDDSVRHALAPRYLACFTTRLGYLPRAADLSRVPRLDTYYLQSPRWHRDLFGTSTRGYVGVRAAIRAVRGIT